MPQAQNSIGVRNYKEDQKRYVPFKPEPLTKGFIEVGASTMHGEARNQYNEFSIQFKTGKKDFRLEFDRATAEAISARLIKLLADKL